MSYSRMASSAASLLLVLMSLRTVADMVWTNLPPEHLFFENSSTANLRDAAFASSRASLTTDKPRLVLMVVYSTSCSHCSTVSRQAINVQPVLSWLSEEFEVWAINERKHNNVITAYKPYLTDLTPDVYPLLAIIDPRDGIALRASKGSSEIGTTSLFQSYFQMARPVHNVRNLAAGRRGSAATVAWDTPVIRAGFSDNVQGFVVARYAGTPPAGEFFLQNRTVYTAGSTVGGWTIVASGGEAAFPPGNVRGGHSFEDGTLSPTEQNYTYRVFAYTDFVVNSQSRRLYSGGIQAAAENQIVTIPPVAAGSVAAGNTRNDLSWVSPGAPATAFVVLGGPTAESFPAELSAGVVYPAGATVGGATVLYAGSGTTFADVGRTNGVPRHYRIFARDNTPNYSVAFTPSGSPATPNFLPFNVSGASVNDRFSCAVDLGWTNPAPAAGNLGGVFILRTAGAPPPENAAQAQALRENSATGSAEIADLTVGGGGIVAGAAATHRDTTAQNGIAYYYKVFCYDTAGTFSSGVVLEPASPSFGYARLAPGSASISWQYSAATGGTGIRLGWGYDTGQCIQGVLILHTANGPVAETPVTGNLYAGTFGNSNVVLSGAGTPVDGRGATSFFFVNDINRIPGTTHHYRIFPMSANNEYGPGLSVGTDADLDGLDDRWEVSFPGYNVTQPDSDTDGDELSNRYEFVHLSDPTDEYDPVAPPEGLQRFAAGWHNRPISLSTGTREGTTLADHIGLFTGYQPPVWYWDVDTRRFKDGSGDTVFTDRPYWIHLRSDISLVLDVPSATRGIDPVVLYAGWNNVALPQWLCDSVGGGKAYATLGALLADQNLGLGSAGTVWRWRTAAGGFEDGVGLSDLKTTDSIWIWVVLPAGAQMSISVEQKN